MKKESLFVPACHPYPIRFFYVRHYPKRLSHNFSHRNLEEKISSLSGSQINCSVLFSFSSLPRRKMKIFVNSLKKKKRGKRSEMSSACKRFSLSLINPEWFHIVLRVPHSLSSSHFVHIWGQFLAAFFSLSRGFTVSHARRRKVYCARVLEEKTYFAFRHCFFLRFFLVLIAGQATLLTSHVWAL